MTANGWDSDGTAGTPAGNEGPQAGSSPGAWDPAAGQAEYGSQTDFAGQTELAGQAANASQAESAPDQLPGGLPPRSLVSGMAVRSPALDYMLGKQRRRMRHVAIVAASALALVVVGAAVTIAAHNGSKKTGSAQLTAARVMRQATQRQNGLDSESATFSEHLSGQVSAAISGTVEIRRKPLLMAMNMNLTAGSSQAATIRAILSHNAMYIKLSGGAGIPNSLAAKWLKIPLTGLSQSSVFGVLEQELQNGNPTSELAGLSAASHLRAVGSQVVSGVSTTRYNGSFAPSAAVKALPASERGALAPLLDQIKGDVSFSVWIDSSHYVRKIQETESTGHVTIAIQCTYGSFNQPVKIVLPPQREVYSPPASVLND